MPTVAPRITQHGKTRLLPRNLAFAGPCNDDGYYFISCLTPDAGKSEALYKTSLQIADCNHVTNAAAEDFDQVMALDPSIMSKFLQ